MNQVNEEQVRAAFDTAGIGALDHPASIAASINAMLAGAGKAFAALPFEAEPASFAVTQVREKT